MSTLMFAKIAAERAAAEEAAREARRARQRAADARLTPQRLPPLRTGMLPLAAGDLPADDAPPPQPTPTAATSTSRNVGQYVEALAGLIPAEVLTLHALTLTVTTTILSPSSSVGKAAHAAIASATLPAGGSASETPASSAAITTISAPETLAAAFWGLIALSLLLYLVPRGYSAWKAADPPVAGWRWYREMRFLDWVSAAIPPLSFVAWTMLQRTTAFDAAFPHVAEANRTVFGLFLAVVLLAVSGWVAFKPVTDDSHDTDIADDADANPPPGDGSDENAGDDTNGGNPAGG